MFLFLFLFILVLFFGCLHQLPVTLYENQYIFVETRKLIFSFSLYTDWRGSSERVRKQCRTDQCRKGGNFQSRSSNWGEPLKISSFFKGVFITGLFAYHVFMRLLLLFFPLLFCSSVVWLQHKREKYFHIYKLIRLFHIILFFPAPLLL